MSRAWKSFGVYARKGLDCHKGTVGRIVTIKGDSGVESEKRRVGGQVSIFSEYIVLMSNMLVGICILKVILVKSQMKMRNILLETGGKAVPVMRWQNLAFLMFYGG